MTGNSTLPGVTNPAAQSGATATTVAGGAGSTTRAVAGVSPAGGGVGAQGGAGSAAAPVIGGPPSAASAGTIQIGLVETKNQNALFSSLGGKGYTENDPKLEQDAIVGYLNAHGGLAGRRIVPVYATFDATSSSTFDASMQAICTTWTEDHHVFAGFYVWAVEQPTLESCLQAHNTPIVYNSIGGRCEACLDEAVYQRYANIIYTPVSFELDRMSRAYVDGLVKQGFFTPGARVGVVMWDLPSFPRAVDTALRPELAKYNIKLTDVATVHWPNAESENGDFFSGESNAMLRFRTDQISHVLFLDSGGSGALANIFLQAAEPQSYRPRYGLTSGDVPDVLRVNVPAAQLNRAVGVGWDPGADVGFQQAVPAHQNTTVCLDILKAAGDTFSDDNAENTALGLCDALFFLQSALARAPALSVAGLRTGVESIGSSFNPATAIPTSFGPGRHDGVAAVRYFGFNNACGCFRYDATGLHPAG